MRRRAPQKLINTLIPPVALLLATLTLAAALTGALIGLVMGVGG